LIKNYESGSSELYNLKSDLSEENDLAEQYPERVTMMENKLNDWLLETNANMPKPNPDYKE